MKISHPFFINLGGWLAALGIRTWMRTLEYKIAYYDPLVDPSHPSFQGPKLFIFWHEFIPFPVYLRSNSKLTILLSTHVDAQILSRTALHMGFDVVRGSTNRNSLSALRGMTAKGRSKSLAITPDGPRGPHRELAQGPVFLASKLQMPIVAMGFGYDRPWRLDSWDRFAIPRPGSRARAVISPELHLPADLDRKGIEHYRVELQKLLNLMTLEAEAWAESGTHKVNEVPFLPQRAATRRERIDPPHVVRAPFHLAAQQAAKSAQSA